MMDKTDMRQAGIVAVAAAENLVRGWWHSVAVSLPALFVLKSGCAGVFKGGNNMVGGVMSNIMIRDESGSLVMVDVPGNKVFFKQSLIYFFGAPVLMVSGDLAAQYYPKDVSRPV